MPTVLDGDEMVIAHGKSKFLSHDKVAKLIREAGGCLGSSVNLIQFSSTSLCHDGVLNLHFDL